MFIITKMSDECVLVDLSKIVPAMNDYNIFAIPMDSWNSHERQLKAMGTDGRLAKLKRCKKLARDALQTLKMTTCPTARIVYYLCFKRFMVTTAVVAFSIMRINDPKKWPIRKVVTPEGNKAWMNFLTHKKKRWASVDTKRGNVHLFSDEKMFYKVPMCKCHPDALAKHIIPNVSLVKK